MGLSEVNLTSRVLLKHLFKHLTSVALPDSSFSVVLIMAQFMEELRERVQHWRQELNFPTQKDRIKSLS